MEDLEVDLSNRKIVLDGMDITFECIEAMFRTRGFLKIEEHKRVEDGKPTLLLTKLEFCPHCSKDLL